MNPSDSQSYVERKLYINAAEDWCRLRAGERADISYDGITRPSSGLVRCFIDSVGPLDIRVELDGVTASCNGTTTVVADPTTERFDQQRLFSRLDGILQMVTAQPDQPAPTNLKEGSRAEVTLDRYERSRAARAACIAAHGTSCAICGFDFARTYGPDFAGIIQVHHIVPLHIIAEEHAVDPIKDLIPVCPNCHVALHSKHGGTYLPDELRALMR